MLLLGGLVACGQKGPLFIPDSVGEIVTRPIGTPATPATEAGASAPAAGETAPRSAPAPATPDSSPPERPDTDVEPRRR